MKSNKGITLVALIITIIVLLILAMVSISLVINSGIITKSKTAVDKYSEEEISEQMKLAYAEYQMSRFTDNSEEFSELLKTKLEKTYGEGNVDVISSNDTVVLKVNDNGTSRFYEYNPSTSVSKELQKGINYGGKNPSEIQPGDDITIVTEKFKVFAVEDNKIKAMPYYNLKLNETPIKQITAEKAGSGGVGNAGTVAFANNNKKYWEEESDINMDAKEDNNYKNNLQQYIDAYKETLEEFETNVIVRIARLNEVKSLLSDQRNPSLIGSFWIGTSNKSNDVYSVQVNGINPNRSYYNGESIGVRPIIEIPIQ